MADPKKTIVKFDVEYMNLGADGVSLVGQATYGDGRTVGVDKTCPEPFLLIRNWRCDTCYKYSKEAPKLAIKLYVPYRNAVKGPLGTFLSGDLQCCSEACAANLYGSAFVAQNAKPVAPLGEET